MGPLVYPLVPFGLLAEKSLHHEHRSICGYLLPGSCEHKLASEFMHQRTKDLFMRVLDFAAGQMSGTADYFLGPYRSSNIPAAEE